MPRRYSQNSMCRLVRRWCCGAPARRHLGAEAEVERDERGEDAQCSHTHVRDVAPPEAEIRQRREAVTARIPSSDTSRQQVRLRDVSAVRLLTARMPSSATLTHEWRVSEVIAVQLLTAFTPSSVTAAIAAVGDVERRERRQVAHCPHALVRQHVPCRCPLDLQRHHRRKPPHQHAHGSSVVCHLSTSRFTIASCTTFHAAHTSRTVAEA
jgi:hypothetical protein